MPDARFSRSRLSYGEARWHWVLRHVGLKQRYRKIKFGVVMTSFTLKNFEWATAGYRGHGCCVPVESLFTWRIWCYRNVFLLLFLLPSPSDTGAWTQLGTHGKGWGSDVTDIALDQWECRNRWIRQRSISTYLMVTAQSIRWIRDRHLRQWSKHSTCLIQCCAHSRCSINIWRANTNPTLAYVFIILALSETGNCRHDK